MGQRPRFRRSPLLAVEAEAALPRLSEMADQGGLEAAEVLMALDQGMVLGLAGTSHLFRRLKGMAGGMVITAEEAVAPVAVAAVLGLQAKPRPAFGSLEMEAMA